MHLYSINVYMNVNIYLFFNVLYTCLSRDFTFWDNWSLIWKDYVNKCDEIGHIDILFMLGNVKYWGSKFYEFVFTFRIKNFCFLIAVIFWSNYLCIFHKSDDSSIHNALFGTRKFMNREVPCVLAFKKR